MKKLLLAWLWLPLAAMAHEGHNDQPQAPASAPHPYFTAEASSDKYELLLKYEPLDPGETGQLRLFVSEFNSNKAVDKASITITSPEIQGAFTIQQADKGVYLVSGTFPEAKHYNLNVKINAALGADLLLLPGISVGEQLADMAEAGHKDGMPQWLLFGGGLLAGVLLVLLITRLRGKKVNAPLAVLILSLVALPLGSDRVIAHEGHNEPAPAGKGGLVPGALYVPKETQFLFDLFTQRMAMGNFTESTKLFGTVIPASSGQALVQTPQTGKIQSLPVKVGEQVKQGQLLAVIEQSLDAGTQVNLLAEKNNILAEYEAARKDYERLQSISDIAAKKDLAEAEARYRKAQQNKQLYDDLTSGKAGSAKLIYLKSPINGTVGNFNFALGATVNANETLFTVTNLSKVYVEAQVFDKDAEHVNTGERFMVECTNNQEHKTADVKLLARAQSINPTNQSQRVIFEMENREGEFKIGEFVNIHVFAGTDTRQLAVPNSAMTEINGRPAVFVKDKAEQYHVAYVSAGENNGSFTVIRKGIAPGDRVVINSTYQLKMIYLNQ